MYYWPDGPAPREASDTAWAMFAAEVYAAAAERAGRDRPAPPAPGPEFPGRVPSRPGPHRRRKLNG